MTSIDSTNYLTTPISPAANKAPFYCNNFFIEDFKKSGYFKNGSAFYKGKRYNGTIIVDSKDNGRIKLKYIDGNLFSSECKTFEKKYSRYPNGKIRLVDITNYDNIGLFRMEKSNEELHIYKDKIVLYSNDFKKTKEGKRRASQNDDEIKEEAQKFLSEFFRKNNIEQEAKPQIKIEHRGKYGSDFYDMSCHTITINADTYKEGSRNLESTTAHEATHAIAAILKSKLTPLQKKEIIIQSLLNKIINGENETILVDCKNNTIETMKSPKMSQKMREEFARFAKDNLYETVYVNLDLDTKEEQIEKLIDDNPDFIAQYNDKKEAIAELKRYAKSHNVRYALTLSNECYLPDLKKLDSRKKKTALKFLKTQEDEVEVNALMYKYIVSSQEIPENIFFQYNFSPQEVKAKINQNKFFIEKLKQRKKQLKKQGILQGQYLAYINDRIEKSNMQIEYLKKGLIYYEQYKKFLNNPNDTDLEADIDKKRRELEKIQCRIESLPMVNVIYFNNLPNLK